MDDPKRAQARKENSQALKRCRKSLIACRACHYCGEAIEPKELFCDLECWTEYEREHQDKG